MEEKLKEAVQLLKAWETTDPRHYFDEYDPKLLGRLTRKFLDSLKEDTSPQKDPLDEMF